MDLDAALDDWDLEHQNQQLLPEALRDINVSDATSRHATSRHVTSRHATSCHVTSRRVTPLIG